MHDVSNDSRCGYLNEWGQPCAAPPDPGQIRCSLHGAGELNAPVPSSELRVEETVEDNPRRLRSISRIEAELLEERGITEEILDAYPPHLVAISIHELIDDGIGANEAAEWPERFVFGNEIVSLKEVGLTPETADRWPDRFTGLEISALHEADIGPDEAGQWPEGLDGSGIVYLHNSGITPEEAATYPAWMPARHIKLCVRRSIPGRAAAEAIEPGISVRELEATIDML